MVGKGVEDLYMRGQVGGERKEGRAGGWLMGS